MIALGIVALGNGCLIKSGFESPALSSESRRSLATNPSPNDSSFPPAPVTPTPPVEIPSSPTADVVDSAPPTTFNPPPTPSTIPNLASLPFKNPCYSTQHWKNWMTDNSSVTISTGNGNVTLDLPDESRRATVENVSLSYDKSLKLVPSSDNNAGFFQDVYVTNDNAHTVPSPNYLDPFAGQMNLDYFANLIKVGWTTSLQERMKAGTSFTSQSTTGMGHTLIADSNQVKDNECNFLYIGTVRAGPAYLSYQSARENKRLMQYDGLQAFMYNSIGQSGSELPAIGKMGIAAATLNRSVKSSFKRLGLQSSYVLTNFRKNLPLLRAGYKQKDFSDDIFHQPAYFSDGEKFDNMINGFAWTHPHYEAISYDRHVHMVDMITDSQKLKALPPVANVKLLSISTMNNGAWIARSIADTSRVKATGLTFLKLHGLSDDQAVKVVVSFKDSFDPQSFPTRLRVKSLYHNHNHLLIAKINETDYEITVPKVNDLPRGMIPVIAYTHNGIYESLPVFINFYFQQSNFVDIGYSYAQLSADTNKLTDKPESEVFNNQVPIISLEGSNTIKANIQNEIRFSCVDPEGFKTRLYQWKNDRFLINAAGFVKINVAANEVGKSFTLHILCSDGTGGFSGKHQEFQIIN